MKKALFYRIAKGLLDAAAAADPDMSEKPDPNNVFQTARMIVIAEWQSIVYDEYLPILLGN